MGAPKARCSPERRMCETLLLANPYTNTLRHQCSRASTISQGTRTAPRAFKAPLLGNLVECSAQGPRGEARQSQHDVYLLLQWLVSRLMSSLVRCMDIRAWYGLTHPVASFRGGVAGWFGMRTNSVEGCPRIARGGPWAGSVTGGEARQNPCSEKEGFTHP